MVLLVFGLVVQPVVFVARAGGIKRLRVTVGVYYGFGATQDTDLKMLHLELLKRLGGKLGVAYTLRVYRSLDLFETAVKNEEMDFVQAPLGGARMVPAALKAGYRPVLLVSARNRRTDQMCVFTRNGKTLSKWKDLKGKKLLVGPEKMAYFLLRKELGQDPQKVVEEMIPVSSAFSGFYGLMLGQGDGVFSHRVVYDSLKEINPGAVARIQRGVCAEPPLPMPILLVHPRVPKKHVADTVKLARQAEKEPLFKPYRPLIKKFHIKMVEPEKADYDPMLRLWKKAHQEGWNKNYDAWRKTL